MTERELLAMVPPQYQERALSAIKTYSEGEEQIPLVIKIILGVGAWIAASLLLTFVGGTFFLILSDAAMPVMALLLMGAALAVKLAADSQSGAFAVFTGQCSFFMMLTGKLFMLVYLVNTKALNSLSSFILAMLIITVASYPFYKSSLDRFLGSVIILGALFLTHTLTLFEFSHIGFFDKLWLFITPADLGALLFAFTLWVFIRRKTILFPIAYAAIVSLGFIAFDSIFINYKITTAAIPAGQAFFKQIFTVHKIILIFAALAALYWHFKQTGAKLGLKAAAVLTAIMLPLNAAAIMGLTYIVLGRYLKEIKLSVLGYAVFCGGLFFLYYSLASTLLFKSYMLCASGVITLAAAYIYGRFFNEN